MKELKSEIDLDDSSKRQKYNTDLVDTISTLPDSVLGFILSFLPTKEAVWTSVLSKRWKSVWVIVQNLDFSYVGCWKEHDADENTKFIRFVNRVLLLNDVGLINKFSLVWHPWCISSRCSSWINTAIARNVRHLSLSGQFDLPRSVLSCDSLQSLELKGRIYVPDAFAVCLPRLERLELDGVDFMSEEAFEKLINGCSMLYYLCLDIYSNGDDDFTYVISSASLRRFELCFKHKCSLKLKTASLEYMEVFGCISETFVQGNLSSLVGAYFSIHLLRDGFLQDAICNSIVEAVRAFDSGKALNLSADVMRPITRFHPGRVLNMLMRESLRPDNIKMFVLQEAVLSREFEDQVSTSSVICFIIVFEITVATCIFYSLCPFVCLIGFVLYTSLFFGHTVYAIHGDVDQNTRDVIMRDLSYVLIATNLSARSIDGHEAPLVINYDLPTQPEKYLHRSGHFGWKKSIFFVLGFMTPDEEKMVSDMQKFYNVEEEYLSF